MANTYWHRQSNKPLFEDLLWSKPETKALSGKLLIIGGNLHAFSAPAKAHAEATKAGAGHIKILLPVALQKILSTTDSGVNTDWEFAPSNNSGSFSKQALAEWLDWSKWSDGVLLAGDLGRNSETAVVLESFLDKYSRQVTITKDAVDYFSSQPHKLFNRTNTTLVVSFAQLQKFCTNLNWPTAFTFSMTLQQLVEALHSLSEKYQCNVVVEHNGVIFVAVDGQVSTTHTPQNESWRVSTAAHCAVWWLQNPKQPFQALTTAVLELV